MRDFDDRFLFVIVIIIVIIIIIIISIFFLINASNCEARKNLTLRNLMKQF